MINRLRTLCSLPGVSGQEEPVRYEILRQIEGHCIYKVDALGNIIAYKKGKREPSRKLLLHAHMDEVGIILTHIEKDGLIRFATVGGIDKRVLAGRPVQIGDVSGVVGSKPVHLKSAEEKGKVSGIDSLYIDIGASSRERAEEHVQLGQTGIFSSEFMEFGEDMIRGRALDDRAGCALLIELIQEETLPYDTWFAFTVQEETGTTGAKTVGEQVRPDINIAVETTTACDIPGVSPDRVICSLKKGPVISFMDRGTIYDSGLYQHAVNVAKEQGITYQIKSAVMGGNEARSVQVAGNGSRALAISLPCRYLHTPSCVISKFDYEETGKLLAAMIEQMEALS